MALTPKQQRFVDEYLVDLNATQAAIRSGYSRRSAAEQGHDLLRKPQVAAAVQAGQAARAERTGITADRVLTELARIAFADHRQLVEHRRTCCRCCYGRDFGHQRTKAERDAALKEHARLVARFAKRRAEGKLDEGEEAPGPFDERGGIGWDPRRDPNADCPECLGDGRGRTVICDTRGLDDDGRALYAGVKETKEGLEVKVHSKDRALELLGKHLGLFVEKHEHTGPDGSPIQVITAVPASPEAT